MEEGFVDYCLTGSAQHLEGKNLTTHLLCTKDLCPEGNLVSFYYPHILIGEPITIKVSDGSLFVNILNENKALYDEIFCPEDEEGCRELDFTQEAKNAMEDPILEYLDDGTIDNALIFNIKSPVSESTHYQKFAVVSNEGYSKLKPW